MKYNKKNLEHSCLCRINILVISMKSFFSPLELVFTQVGPFYSYNFVSNIFYFLFKVIEILRVIKQFVNIVFISSVMLI